MCLVVANCADLERRSADKLASYLDHHLRRRSGGRVPMRGLDRQSFAADGSHPGATDAPNASGLSPRSTRYGKRTMRGIVRVIKRFVRAIGAPAALSFLSQSMRFAGATRRGFITGARGRGQRLEFGRGR